jgi:amphi-Trp domain-containing protein
MKRFSVSLFLCVPIHLPDLVSSSFLRCSPLRARGGAPSGRILLPWMGVDYPAASVRRIDRTASTGPMAEDRDLEKVYTRKQFAAKLRRLANSIETEKAFTIQVAGERLKIPADAEFNVEHERSGDTEELEFQLRWKRAAE